MAKLADIDSEVRIILKVAAGAIVVFIALFLFFQGGTIAKNLFFPTPLPPPAEKFGKLPRVEFPAQEPIKGVEYRINTLSGQLPGLGDRMKVYKIKKDPPSLVALENARNNVKEQGFTLNETKISEEVYQWNNEAGAQIQYNTVSNNFNIATNFLNEPPPALLTGNAADKEGAYNYTLSYLQKMNEDTSDFDPERSTALYLKLVNNQLTPAGSQSDAQFIKLSLFQKNIDKYKVYYPGFSSSNMWFIYRDEDLYPIVEQASYTHLIPGSSTTYPIKTTEQAFKDLQDGNALIFNAAPNSTIDVTDVSLGYYLGEENQEYTVPIIIFSGKDFAAYVQALPNSSISN